MTLGEGRVSISCRHLILTVLRHSRKMDCQVYRSLVVTLIGAPPDLIEELLWLTGQEQPY